MINDLKPLHDEALGCFQDLVWSVSSWWGRHYELMFAEAWEFILLPQNTRTPAALGNRVLQDTNRYRGFLKVFHGIQIENHNPKSSAKALKIVTSELLAGRPLIIAIQSFYCPWDIGYRRHYSVHFFLIVGFDKHYLYCVDGFYNKQNVQLPLNDFKKGVLNCITFAKIGEEKTDVDWREIIENAVARVKGEKDIPDTFKEIRAFAEEVRVVDLNNERQGYELFWQTPLILALLNISRGRRQQAKAFGLLASRYNLPELHILGKELEQAGWCWDTIRSLLMKASMKSDPGLVLQKIAEKIMEAADNEERIAQDLLQFCRQGVLERKTEITATAFHEIAAVTEITFIDLSNYCNNKGFGSSLSLDCTADLIGNGSYFLTENLRLEEIWQVEEMKFRFPSLDNHRMDNISCFGQTIMIPSGKYSRIYTLGCAEWTNYSDRMTIQYAHGETEEVPLEFTDWSFAPVFGEFTAWEGYGAQRHNGTVERLALKMKLYAKSYDLKKTGEIVSIHLPDCPNLHLFSLSLAR